jgi:Ni,Fe-hydrogenase I large subunit
MRDNFKVITLCGSTKFKKEFHEMANKLTKEGNIILMPHCYDHADNEVLSEEEKQMMVAMHLQMIGMSDEIFVINVGKYIGDSTTSEIEYALNTGKLVSYLE